MSGHSIPLRRALYLADPAPLPLPFYFGVYGQRGHFMYSPHQVLYRHDDVSTFRSFPRAWLLLLDGGLLANMRVPDRTDGRVAWTVGVGADRTPWHALVWWDRSGDSRPGSNSGLYVPGFAAGHAEAALAAGLAAFPDVRDRQLVPFILDPHAPPA